MYQPSFENPFDLHLGYQYNDPFNASILEALVCASLFLSYLYKPSVGIQSITCYPQCPSSSSLIYTRKAHIHTHTLTDAGQEIEGVCPLEVTVEG